MENIGGRWKEMGYNRRETVLFNNLTRLLLAQENNLPGLEDRVRWLYNQFELWSEFQERGKPLSELEARAGNKHYGWSLIQQIRKLADEAEDVVDTYYRDVAAKQRTDSTAVEPFARDCSSDHTAKLCTLRMSVERTRRTVEKFDPFLLDYTVRLSQCLSPTPRRDWATKDEFETVGLTEESKALVDRLINKQRRELDVMAIVGEGGAGKSTLALKVYNDVEVQRHFGCRGWVSISQKYVLRNLLLKILGDVTIITEDIYDLEEWELKRQLFKQLTGRRYLIVIDDIWSTKAWEELKGILPNNKLASRIMVTTRRGEVASLATGNTSSIEAKLLLKMRLFDKTHEFSRVNVGFLSPDDSWELFCMKYVGKSKENFSLQLETDAREIVKQCGGRPIVIVVVASILRARVIHTRWTRIIDEFRHMGKLDHAEPKEILAVCFHDIPAQLKTCFFYVGVFAEDFEIPVNQLLQLWIAEGFIPHWVNKYASLEDIAEDYLKELVDRNLIQVSKRRSDGGPKSCRIHDLLRDLCIDLSPWHEKSLSVYPSKEDDSFPKNPRRLSILGDCPESLWNPDTNSNTNPGTTSDTCNSSHGLRSLSCFSQDNRNISEENWKSIFNRFPLLRVLNFGEGEVGKLPKAIEDLFQLRYLKVKPAKNMSFPTSVFNLWNLQTIDLRTTKIFELPKEIWKMQQLRHLYLYGQSRLPKAERKDDCLPNLQTLSYIQIDPDDDIGISQKAPNLRKLGLYEYRCFSMSEENVTFDLPHLHSLKFAEVCTFEEPIKLPDTITKITVKRAHLQQEVIKILKKLPKLQILKLIQTSFDDAELDFGEGSFPQLRLLKIEDSIITTWKGTVPSLCHLVINNCPLLTKLPADQLCDMNTLQELELNWVSTKLADQLAKDLKDKQGLKLKIYPPPSYTRGA